MGYIEYFVLWKIRNKKCGRGLRDYLDVFLGCFKVRLEFLFFMFFDFLWEDLRDVLLEVLRDLGVVETFRNIWSKCSSSKTG